MHSNSFLRNSSNSPCDDPAKQRQQPPLQLGNRTPTDRLETLLRYRRERMQQAAPHHLSSQLAHLSQTGAFSDGAFDSPGSLASASPRCSGASSPSSPPTRPLSTALPPPSHRQPAVMENLKERPSCPLKRRASGACCDAFASMSILPGKTFEDDGDGGDGKGCSNDTFRNHKAKRQRRASLVDAGGACSGGNGASFRRSVEEGTGAEIFTRECGVL